MNSQVSQEIAVSGIKDALILFADVVDSSVYSSTWGSMRYANELRHFQELFKILGEIYFNSIGKNKVETLYEINARGDEGTVFCVDPNIPPEELVYKAVKFSFELKARMEQLGSEIPETENAPKKMKIAIGIHYGRVAILVAVEKDKDTGTPRSIIKRIEGFSINYGKRIESSSRIGKFSKVFLSKIAASFLENDPIVLFPHSAALKGIETNEEVFEVCSAFFDNMPQADLGGVSPDKLLEFYSDIDNELTVKEPWLKGFIVSVLDSRAKILEKDKVLQNQYLKLIRDFAWRKPFENDPIMLFWRARECLLKREFTKSLTYLKKIVERHPYFIHAKKKMVQVCWELSNASRECSELIFARDTAKEFLDFFPKYLTEKEKKLFEEILKKNQKKSKRKNKAKLP